jgi:ABC-2 type transport system ATP-binding protein
MLEAIDLVKSYGTRRAVEKVSLSVGRGQMLGLLGPNGAGKSTTIGMISGLIVPDGGSVLVSGQRLDSGSLAFKRHIGLVPQDIALFDDLTAQANLELFGALYGIKRAPLLKRVHEVLELVGLADRARDKPVTFSGGMKRRLNIAAALIHDPDVLLLDEPTAGVDPQSRNAIFENLEELKRRGKALVYTTHYMEEAERLADAIVIIDHGQVVARGTPNELYRLLPATGLLEIELEGPFDAAPLGAIAGVMQVERNGQHLRVGLDDLTLGTPLVMNALVAQNARVARINSGRANLENVFLALTGHALRD